MRERSGWRGHDTLVVFGSFSGPLVSMIAALVWGESWSLGNWSAVEIGWTVWAVGGMLLAAVKVWLLAGDLHSVDELNRSWRYRLGAWWTLANAGGLFFAFLAWAIVGCIAGQLPTDPPTDGADGAVPVEMISGALFLAVEAVLFGVLTFGLICRVRLAE